ncbi:helicase RepA family protein [Cereibacter azotoformans]|uniref:Plasmid and phage replicative helicase n=1 Tax=Cereibacter azotoformans TaxID=43057 RepID=A0A2T5JLJ2_9RHOB|nr:helicase RepA family protein [Cereibacter azotoformans]PTR07770.1 plasmid and phage replicative helicase [Cereibacter azotoformans]
MYQDLNFEPDMPPSLPDEAYASEFEDYGRHEQTGGETQGPCDLSPTPWRRNVPPPRQWLYGYHLQRRMLSGTISPGGIGKSSLALVDALSMVTGRKRLHSWVHSREGLRVWYWCGEDPVEEISRRLEAACIHYGISDDEIGGRLCVDSGRDQPIKIATADREGVKIARPVVAELVAQMRALRIDVLIIDPFITCHSVPENDNVAMNAVIDAWRDVANQTNAAIELIHHTAKAGTGDSINDGRGASAFRDGIRAGRVLAPMSFEEGERMGLTPAETARIFRSLDGAKPNMSARGAGFTWYRMETVTLNNPTPAYPEGDEIGVCTAWTPPDAFEGVKLDDLRQVQDAIAARETPPAKAITSREWVGYVVADTLGLDVGEPGTTKDQQSPDQKAARTRVGSMINTWLRNGALRVETVRSPRDGRDKQQIVVGIPAGDHNETYPQSPQLSAE